MFESEKIKRSDELDLSKLTNEALIERYKLVQKMNNELGDANPDAKEKNFAHLNRLQTEIERRGLKAKTMEERGI